MAPAVVAIFLITLFVEGLSAPSWCGDCQTWESHSGSQTHRGFGRQINPENLSQRSENLEDLTQQAETELNRSPNQLPFDNTRPGNWTDVNHYRTSDGHGRVYEEQGQRVDGSNRIRFSRRNFTSSYSSGSLGSFGETNLGHIYPNVRQDESQLLNRESLDQSQNSAYDRFATGRNFHTTQDSLHSTERVNSHNDASRYYENHGNSGRISGITSGQSSQQGINVLDRTRPGNWSTVNTFRTNEGNGRVYEERGQIVTGPRRVHFYARNYTSSYASGGGIPTLGLEGDNTRNIESTVQQMQRQFDSYGRELHQSTEGSTNGDYTQHYPGDYTSPSQTSRQTNYRYVSRPSNYESQNQNTLDSNSHQTYQHTTNLGNRHVSQSSSSSFGGSGQLNGRNPDSGYSTGSYTSGSGYNHQGTLEIPSSGHTGHQIPYYNQFQTTSDSSSAAFVSRPDTDLRTIQSGSDLETQRTLNTHNSFDQTTNNNRIYRIQNGQLVTQGIDLGQIAQAPDCAEGTNGYSSYEQSSRRIYRGAAEPHDLSQQVQDLTQQTEDLTQQTEDLTQQTQDLTQQTEDLTQQNQDFGQQSSWRPGKLEVGSQQVEDLTQQTEDLTQQTEDLTQQSQDLTQQTEDLTQQNQDFGQQSSWRPGKLEVGSQQIENLPQQTEGLTQQTEDLTQQTEDLTQQAEDLTQQNQDFGQQPSRRPGKLEVGSQQVEDLTQQTEDLTQQTEDLTQQTEDLTQQTEDLTQQTEDLTQQTEDLTQQNQDFGQQSFWRPGKLEVGSQQIENLPQQTEGLTQQTEDLTQQTEDLTQQAEDLTQQNQDFGQQPSRRPGKLEVGSQQVEDLTQQTEDLTQQTEDLTQQTEDLTQQTEDLTQQTEDLTQQTEDLTQQNQDFGQQSFWRPGKLEVGSQQIENLPQQTEGLTQQTEDLTQQTEDLTQQTEDLTQQNQDFGPQSSWRPGKLEVGSQQVEDLTQQTEHLTQQTEDVTQQTEDLTQQNQDFGPQSFWRPGKLEVGSQQVEDLTQQTEDLTQQTEDLTQQTEDLTQQTEGETQQNLIPPHFQPWHHERWQAADPNYVPLQTVYEGAVRPENSDITSQQPEDLTQQTEDFGQQTQDLTQQSEDLGQQTEDFGQQTQDLTQKTEDLGQQTEDFGQQTQDLTQQTEDLGQQTEYFGQQTQDLGQQTEDLGQQTQGIIQETDGQSQQNENFNGWREQITSGPGFGQESPWNSDNLEIGGQQTENFYQENQFGKHQTIIHPGQPTRPAPKPAPKPKRPSHGNFHHTQEINIEIEEPTVSNADSHTVQHNDQQNSEKWVSTGVPPTPQRGDQGINVNSNEPEEADINIESDIPKIPEHQIQYVYPYPDSSSQQTTSGNQFRETQPTKTKTSRRRGNNAVQYQGPQGWHSRDLSISQDPTIRLVDRRINSGDLNLPQSANTGQVIQDFQQHLTNPKEIEQLESGQTVQRIQPLGAAIESRQRSSGQSEKIVFPESSEVSFSPRILEAFGANGPYGEHDLDIFDSAKQYPDTTTVLTPPENGNDWDIREVDRIVTTTTEAPTPLPSTTTTPLPTTTPPPPPTPAPGFWKKLGNTFSTTVEKAKDKARDWFG